MLPTLTDSIPLDAHVARCDWRHSSSGVRVDQTKHSSSYGTRPNQSHQTQQTKIERQDKESELSSWHLQSFKLSGTTQPVLKPVSIGGYNSMFKKWHKIVRMRWELFVIHFWAPTFKWGISIANIADFTKPPEKLSYPQQIAVTCTGVIWSRYSTVITPKNWNLFSVNVVMATTGMYQLSRKLKHDYFSEGEEEPAIAKE
ncbi:hypothetical protein JRO89_XS06G0154100 [Xanthoceras sorbifolium]|uniref:Mitochondrial pyruvate carrier n=1 Tax=Xanthoceras sorbifolium TaxID=99658 RepID=A0ABQ8HYG0_9ROSI|nr:hypothetical protein JRO89_XS06G0154100 [Xanthoceras sorbifolium]